MPNHYLNQWWLYTWTNDDFISVGPLGVTSGKLQSKFQLLHSTKCTWKCCMQNVAILFRPQCFNPWQPCFQMKALLLLALQQQHAVSNNWAKKWNLKKKEIAWNCWVYLRIHTKKNVCILYHCLTQTFFGSFRIIVSKDNWGMTCPTHAVNSITRILFY